MLRTMKHLLLCAVAMAPIGYAQGNQVLLTGTIRTAASAQMEGATVSARGVGRTFTTTVFTDAAGGFYFPQLDAGRYKVWAQAVGFDAAVLDLELTGAVQRQ